MELKITSDTVPGFMFHLVGDYTGQADEVSADFQRGIEDLAFLRAKGIEPADRGNASVELQVSLCRLFTNSVDCALWIMDLSDAVPATGRVEISVTENGRRGTRIVEHASIPRIRPRNLGTSCMVTFQIRGGVVTKTNS